MSIKIDLTEGQIQNAIAVALAESFSPEKKDQLIRDIVRAHLTQKANAYDRETLLSKSVGDAVRNMASGALASEIEKLRPRINEVVSGFLGEGVRINIVDQVKSAIQRMVISNLKVSVSAEADGGYE